eukprot:1160022-Amphidinium_carterae.1
MPARYFTCRLLLDWIRHGIKAPITAGHCLKYGTLVVYSLVLRSRWKRIQFLSQLRLKLGVIEQETLLLERHDPLGSTFSDILPRCQSVFSSLVTKNCTNSDSYTTQSKSFLSCT